MTCPYDDLFFPLCSPARPARMSTFAEVSDLYICRIHRRKDPQILKKYTRSSSVASIVFSRRSK